MSRVFHSVDSAFMYAPNPRSSNAVFEAAREAGVRKVVVLSSASVVTAPPGVNPIVERHRAAESAALSAGLNWIFIRPDTLASNCLQWISTIREERRVYTPYPEAIRSAVHEDDIALLAVAGLLGEELNERTIKMTGGVPLRISEQVKIIGNQLGHPIDCVRISPEDAMQRMAVASPGMSPAAATRLLEYLKKSSATTPPASDDYWLATGLLPKSFNEWVGDNIDLFRHVMHSS
jgi:uncharacterized protein YbjT (DUF2867 family)